MSGSGLLGGRYRLEEPPIGQGGMGVVYKAADTGVRNRWVAVKTIRGPVDNASVEQFRKEWDVLADLCHANIVDLYDVGEFADQDGKKPYFVMPLLRGANLGDLLKDPGSRLDTERIVGILCQACKGLQSAHNRGVIHRDLKPSNIFVLDDDSVKIIDFGIVHLASHESGAAVKGTLHYMAPEQLEGKITVQSDIFSLGVVCYEALTGRKPFDGKTPPEVMDAIRLQVPPPISDLNPSIPFVLAQVIHRALAKQVYHRISSAREFSDLLQRAVKNEAIPQFDRSRIVPRLGQIRKALTQGDPTYGKELLGELQTEGHIDYEISLLRVQIEEATRARSVHQLLDAARLRMDEEDYPLAAEKVQAVLDLDPDNIDALALKREIALKRSTAGIERWYRIACQHRDNRLYGKAREAAGEILKIDPGHRPAIELLSQIKRSETEQFQVREQRQQLYQSALKAYGNGEISTALSKLERIFELGKRTLGPSQADSDYERLYNQIRLERDQLQASYAEARAARQAKDLKKAREICRQVLERRPQDALFRALQIELDESERQIRSSAIAEMHGRIEAETDLEAKCKLAEKAVGLFPDEQTFPESLRLSREKRGLVNTIVRRAREYESQSQFSEARSQWDTLGNIYPQYPGLEYELERIRRKQQEGLEERARSDQLENTSRSLAPEDFETTGAPVRAAGSAEVPGDSEVRRLKQEFERAFEAEPEPNEPAREMERRSFANSGRGEILKATELFARPPLEEKPSQVNDNHNWSWVSRESRSAENLLSSVEPVPGPRESRSCRVVDRVEYRSREIGLVKRFGAVAGVFLAVAIAVFTTVLVHSRQNGQVPITQERQLTNASPQSPATTSTGVPGAITATAGSTDSKPKDPTSDTTAQVRKVRAIAVHFRTNPDAAEVQADHNLRCTTPCSLNLTPGDHTLILSAANRDTVRRIITVPGTEDVFEELPQASGVVQVISNPAQLKISVDGQDRGETPVKLRLTTGQHQLKVTGNGITREQNFEVLNEDDGFQILRINLAGETAPPGT